MHLHADTMSFLVFVAFFLIWKLALTLITAQWPESSFSKALGALA